MAEGKTTAGGLRTAAGGLIQAAAIMALSALPAAGTQGGFRFLSSILDAGARDVEVSGGRAYALFRSGLLVFDDSDPGNPGLLGRYFFQEAPIDLRVMGDRVVVADSTSGVQVIDLADPYHPALVGAYPAGGGDPMEAMGLDLKGDTLFVANGSEGLLVLSLDDPADPRFVASLPGIAPSWSVAVEGDYAFLAALVNGLDVVYAGDLPFLEHRARLTGDACPALSVDIRLAMSHAYLGEGINHFLTAVDVSDPDNPVWRSCTPTAGRALDLSIDLPYLYLADDHVGFHIYRIDEDPGMPDWQGTFDTPDDARGIAAEGGIAAVADDYTGLLFFDVSDPSRPESLGIFPSAGECRGGLIAGDLAYIAQGERGLVIADVSDPGEPAILSSFTEGIGWVHSVDLQGSLLVVANNWEGLMTLDVAEPDSPVLLGRVETGRQVTRVAVQGDMAYLVDWDFRAVDLSDPTSPRIVSSYETPGASEDVEVQGDIAFVADREGGVLSFDISNPSDSLRLLDRLDTPGFAVDVAAEGDRLYIADEIAGLRIARYEPTGRMEEIGSYDPGEGTDENVVAVAADGDLVYLGLDRGEVLAVSVSRPDSPVVLDGYPTPGGSSSISGSSPLLLVGDVSSALFLSFDSPAGIRADRPPVRGSLPAGGALRQNHPNPFNPSTVISFILPPPAALDGHLAAAGLDIYSIRGRLVRRLWSGAPDGGEHAATWDGRNSRGEPAASGVYLCVLRIGDDRFVRKMVLVR